MSDPNHDPLRFVHGGREILFSRRLADDAIFREMEREQTFYEIELLEWLAYQRLPDGLVIDVGAFVGTHTVYFGAVLSRDVVAFEPNPVAASLLEENIELNGLGARAEVRQRAVGEAAGTVSLVAGDAGNLGTTSIDVSGDGEIGIVTLDEEFDDGRSIGVLKIDVEGHESAVLRGAAGLLRRERPLVVLECLGPAQFHEAMDLLLSHGYGPVEVFNATPTIVFAPDEITSTASREETADRFRRAWRARADNRQAQRTLSRLYRHQGQLLETTQGVSSAVEGIRADHHRLLELTEQLRDDALRLTHEAAATRDEIGTLREAQAATAATSGRLFADLGRRMDDLQRGIRGSERGIASLRSDVASLRSGITALNVRRDWRYRAQRAWRHRVAIPMEATARRAYRRLPLNDRLRWRVKSVLATGFSWAVGSTESYQRFVRVRDARHAGTRSEARPRPSLPPPPIALRSPDWSYRGNVRDLPDDLSTLRAAVVMDTFSEHSYSPECELLQLEPEDVAEQLTAFDPHLLLIESAWLGREGLWQRKINYCEPELLDAIEWCRANDVPTVFWNKEDPVHFDTFLAAARLFDVVFTTDVDSIPEYRARLGHGDVYLLPFACQPETNHPLERYERQHRFCFAGAYYARYPERQRDIEMFASTLDDLAGFDIFDRNFGKDDPDYAFPPSFHPFILGTLPFEEIDRAYKGYDFAVNMNSIKMSQSMFARRVFELLASNTITVSNFSVGLRKMLGDLVISTDDEGELRRRLEPLLGDQVAYRRLRLAGLRAAMSEHTYAHRLAHVATKTFGRVWEVSPLEVALIAPVANEDDVAAALGHFERQEHSNCRLVIVELDDVGEFDVPAGVRVIRADEEAVLRDVAAGAAVAAIEPSDWYGRFYITDLALAATYTDEPAVGKATRYQADVGGASLIDDGHQYRTVPELARRRSVVFASGLPDTTVAEWVDGLASATVGPGLAVDEFHYCESGDEQVSALVDQCEDIGGVPLTRFNDVVDQIPVDASSRRDNALFVDLNHVFPDREGIVSLRGIDHGVNVSSALGNGEHEYLWSDSSFDIEELPAQPTFVMHPVIGPGLDVSIALAFHGAQGQRLASDVCIANRDSEVEIPAGARTLRVGLRIAGHGTARIESIGSSEGGERHLPHVASSKTLVLTNHYPEYGELYRNAFVHSRVRRYAAADSRVDVFRFNPYKPSGPSEFEGVDVRTGMQQELESVLRTGGYERILVHFLDPAMWEVLEPFATEVDIVLWFHGAEVQAWHRRAFLHRSDDEKETAKQRWAEKSAFWRAVFGASAPLRFVFVSEHLRREVEEDLGLALPAERTHVIHNFVDGETFVHETKTPEQRLRVLSIRPYASAVYANDLLVEAILLLQDDPCFSEFTFHLVGDGPLFEELTYPLRSFANVTLEQGFLTRDEIAALHRANGVFLVPTRMDSQGVSRDEAMASGLVPITNRVAAVPEFVDETCAVLAAPESARELADGLRRLYDNPDEYVRMSAAAAERVRAQSGFDQTIRRELLLLDLAPHDVP